MTGEITLRGRVLPIGGLKDKVLAAHRADIFTVIIPKENRKDLKDIPKKVLQVMKIIAVDHMDEVLRAALRIENPETFLREPSRAVDWRVADRASGDGGARRAATTPTPTVPEPPQPEPH